MIYASTFLHDCDMFLMGLENSDFELKLCFINQYKYKHFSLWNINIFSCLYCNIWSLVRLTFLGMTVIVAITVNTGTWRLVGSYWLTIMVSITIPFINLSGIDTVCVKLKKWTKYIFQMLSCIYIIVRNRLW